jgi:membrane associated rhomboid family serine protease
MGGMGASGGRSVVTILIIINAAVFVLCSITGDRGFVGASPLFQLGEMKGSLVLRGQIWRLVTSDYLHWSFSHILINMIVLHFLGRPLERDWGPKKLLAVYTIAGLLGSVFYLALTLFGWLPMEGRAAGASGCVLGLLGACAVRYPHAQLWIYFLFPVKIRTATLIFAGLYALNVFTGGPNAGGDACHLAGLAFGAWWAFRGDAWWSLSGRSMWTRLKSKLSSRASRPRPEEPKRGFGRGEGVFAERLAQRREDEETIDRILRKVYEKGIHCLTDEEKAALKAATARQKQRESQAGRVDRL